MRFGWCALFLSGLVVACSEQPSGSGEDATVPRRDASFTNVLTQHNDNARTGANTTETCLRPSTLSGLSELATFHLDGQVYAQPLLYAVGGRHLLIMASTANELAAFDVDTLSPTPVWKLGAETFGTPGNVPRWHDYPLGILSTPVIDPTTSRVYVLARSCPTATAVTGCPQAVHAIDIATGKHLESTVVQATFNNGSTNESFNPDVEWNRPALLLQDGRLFAAWAVGQVTQQEYVIIFNGFVLAYDTAHLQADPVVYVPTPRAHGGGIWESGGGLVGDGQSVYFTTGNGELDTSPAHALSEFPAKPLDQENSIVRLQLGDAGVGIASYWDDRPYHSDGDILQYTNFYDFDMSSSGVAWIPGTDDIVSGSKGGMVYLLDRTTMTERQEPLSPFTATPLPAGQSLHIAPASDGPEVVGSPAVWRRTGGADDALVYMWPRSDHLTAFHYVHATSTLTPATMSSDLADASGATLSLSMNGDDASSAILWATVASAGTQYVRAYDPTTLSMLWQTQISDNDAYPGNARYICPTVANGRVYQGRWNVGVTGGSDVLVFGTSACGG